MSVFCDWVLSISKPIASLKSSNPATSSVSTLSSPSTISSECCNGSECQSSRGTGRCKSNAPCPSTTRTCGNVTTCSAISSGSLSTLRFHAASLSYGYSTFQILFSVSEGFLLLASFLNCLFFLHFVLLRELTEFSHFLLELFIFKLDLLFFLSVLNLFLLEVLLLCLKGLMYFIHFPPLLQKLGSRWDCFVLIKCWYLYFFLHRSYTIIIKKLLKLSYFHILMFKKYDLVLNKKQDNLCFDWNDLTTFQQQYKFLFL